MDIQELTAELRLQIKKVDEMTADTIKKEDNNALAYKQGNGDVCFNPKYISAKEYNQIDELEKFLNKHPDVNNTILSYILRGNAFYFRFLRELQESIPNLAETLRAVGAKFVAGIFVGTQLANNCEKEL